MTDLQTQTEQVVEVALSEIDDFPDHPYQVRDDQEMEELTQSVRENGVLMPAIVRRKEDGRFELVSGHRRKHACQLAELETMPVIVRELDRDEAAIEMVESNLQRENVLPSEKAFAYKIRLEAMKRQGKRTDLTSPPLAEKLKKPVSAELLGEIVGESKDQIWRYIRLTYLIKPLLDMVDEGRIAMRPAVELSYLQEDEQTILLDAMEAFQATPSHAQALRMKQLSREGALDVVTINRIMAEEKGNQKEKYSFHRDRLSKYLPAGITDDKVESYVIEALDYFQRARKNRERQRKSGAR